MSLPQPTTLYFLIITLRCPGLAMSDTPPNTPFLKPDYTPLCSNGHGELQWKAVVSNAKGNRGRWMVSCPFIGPDGTKCSHFRWGSRSPSSSPNPSLSPVLPLPPPALPPPPPPVLPVPGTCAESQCASTRVHPLCAKAMCRKHCWAVGGCDAKGHTTVSGPVQVTLAPARPPCDTKGRTAVSGPVQATLAPARPPSPVIDPVLIQASLPGPTSTKTPSSSSSSSSVSLSSFPSAPSSSTSTIPTSSTSAVVLHSTTTVTTTSKGKGKQRATVPALENDFYANPRYPSQLPPVFTNAYATQEEERLRKHQAEILEHELALTAQNTVMAFGWAADDEAPTICEFQSGFVLPRVRVTDEWLRSLGLCGDNGCHYFNPTHQCWNKISVGHVLTLPGAQVYFKNLDVKLTKDFDKHYVDQQPPATPHIRNNLTSERAYIRHATNYNYVQPSSSSESDRPAALHKLHQRQRHVGTTTSVLHKRKLVSPSSPPQRQRRVRTTTSGLSATVPSKPAVITPRAHPRIQRELSVISLSSSLEPSDDETLRHVKQELPTSAHPRIKREPSVISLSSGQETTDDETLRHIKQEPSAAATRVCRALHAVKREPSLDPDTTDEEMSSPGLSYDHPIEVEVAAILPPWPRGYYAVDVNRGFVAMDNARQCGRSVKEAFASVFGAGVRYSAQTISDHRLRWKHAGPSARAMFIEAGQTPDGLWSEFMAAHSTKDAAEKAARKWFVRGSA
ncbi:hypothetical protein C8R48DRAFT_780339 [Suillus tomentosus]|nr:hypothetical protein C8R48DRAFT_780339 [Suillus tomentosus]